MNLENQVCSLELAKRLKELGVSQHSHFKWTDWYNGVLVFGKPAENFRGEWHIVTIPVWNDETIVAAFTVAELGEMLPFFVNKNHIWAGQLMCVRHPNCFTVSYGTMSDVWIKEEAGTEADARAKMLIYLLENKLISI